VFLVNPPTPIPRMPIAAEPASDAGERTRAILRHVRYAINDFRDGQWDGLVRIRNQQLTATTLPRIYDVSACTARPDWQVGHEYTEPAVRAAIWSLIDLRLLTVNSDWKLHSNGATTNGTHRKRNPDQHLIQPSS
jgi:hypothetical protein